MFFGDVFSALLICDCRMKYLDSLSELLRLSVNVDRGVHGFVMC